MKHPFPMQDTPWELRPRKTSSVRNSFVTSYWVTLTPQQKKRLNTLTPIINNAFNYYLSQFLIFRTTQRKIGSFLYNLSVTRCFHNLQKTYKNSLMKFAEETKFIFTFQTGALYDLKATSPDPVWKDVYYNIFVLGRRGPERCRFHYTNTVNRYPHKAALLTKNFVYFHPLGWLRIRPYIHQSEGHIRWIVLGYESGKPFVSFIKDTTSHEMNYIEIPFKFPSGLVGSVQKLTGFTSKDDWILTSLFNNCFRKANLERSPIPTHHYETHNVYINPGSVKGNRWKTFSEEEKQMINERLIHRLIEMVKVGVKIPRYRKNWDD